MRITLHLALLIMGVMLVMPASVAAAPRHRCVKATAKGTGPTEKIARFQVYEGLLQTISLSLWSQWMADGTTPGYVVKGVKYACNSGVGLGILCRGKATICKK
ncbi:MAG: hypothetical protein HOP09_07465 [Hyphomicrobium sp.]|nr:hypothetical protein [Hyphomicrobium sp.]